jgi:AraC family transcriptional activator of pobA
MPSSVRGTIPVFKLYGETGVWPTPDLIHCESIAERSRLHDWEIKPHRHSDLVQLLYVQAGCAELEVEGALQRVEEASLQVVPALSVHGFRFSRDIQGHVLSLALPLVEQLETGLPLAPLAVASWHAVGDEKPQLDALFESISREYSQPAVGRDLLLQSLISMLLVWIGRRCLAAQQREAASLDKGRVHLQRFTRLLEEHYREHWPIERYAADLGLSAAHLNALCRSLAGLSALQVVNQRVLLEAKRNLVYTTMTINQVADSLGFSEPAYFSRFFKRSTGVAPQAFRQRR